MQRKEPSRCGRWSRSQICRDSSCDFLLDIFPYGNIMSREHGTSRDDLRRLQRHRRTPATADYRAARTRRGQDVGDSSARLRLPQPAVSKHLRRAQNVGVVIGQPARAAKVYRVNATELKPVHDWVKHFERFWTIISTHQAARRRKGAADHQRIQLTHDIHTGDDTCHHSNQPHPDR